MRAHLSHALLELDSLLPQWLRRLIRNSEWQKSSALSALYWIAGTFIFFKFVSILGHGWKVNAVVSLSTDMVAYTVNKAWVWKKRQVSLSISVGWSFVWWLGFFGFNMLVFWALLDQAAIGNMGTRYTLGGLGIALNPLVFQFRDKRAFKGADRTAAAS